MKIQLMVLFGGNSVEHEISIISAIQAIHHIDKAHYDVIPVYLTKGNEFYTGTQIGVIEEYTNINQLLKKSTRVVLGREADKVYLYDHPGALRIKKHKTQIDVAFPIVHGCNVEDGSIQGYLKTLGLPFVGCDVIPSAVGMDKHVMKAVLKQFGVPVLDCIVINKYEYAVDPLKAQSNIKSRFNYPLFVKPATLGSSIGISKVTNDESLEDALNTAFSFAVKVLIEPAVTNLREINCAVVGDTEEAEASECEEPLNATDFLRYEDKYMGNGAKSSKTGDSQGMASLSRQIPANLTPALRKEIREIAVKTFQVLGCNGVSRIDFLLDSKTNTVYVNEINTIPGSLAYYLWEPLGITYTKLIDRLVDLCLKREREENRLLHSFDTNVLSLCATNSLSGAKAENKLRC